MMLSQLNLNEILGFVCLGIVLTACSASTPDTSVMSFHKNVQTLCGQIYEGRVISTDAADESWRKEVLTLGPITCVSPEVTTMALAVGEDKTRVWSLSLQAQGETLEFKHAHTLKDGSSDLVTNYGGMASDQSTSTHVVFPIDQESIDTFLENGLEASVANIWSFTFVPNQTLTYELRRENREFIAVFDLTNPV